MFATILLPRTVQYRTWLLVNKQAKRKIIIGQRHVNRPVEGRQRQVGGSILQQVRGNHLALTTLLLVILKGFPPEIQFP
jgi:hypothetical protein